MLKPVNARGIDLIAYSDGNGASIERGFLDLPLDPVQVNAHGLSLRGVQFDYVTPYTQAFNLVTQYELTANDTIQIGYVGSMARHLEVFPGSNEVSEILPPLEDRQQHIPFRDFGYGPSYAATEGSS